MQVFTTVSQVQRYLRKRRRKKGAISFVPTLGALHQGHMALMKHGKELAPTVIASIFVNPTQFNDPSDLEKYPRPLGSDIHNLTLNEIDALFLPTNYEMYPPGLEIEMGADLSRLTSVLEGPRRPGHFEGVVTVVKRLLDIICPEFLIMGQKDFQQQAIIKAMIEQLDIDTTLVTHPTIRESDGLAMSSRNTRIDPALRGSANILYSALLLAQDLYPDHNPGEIESHCSTLIAENGFRLEYFSIVDSSTLQQVRSWEDHISVVACVAAWLGDVRLIDNKILTEDG